MSHYSRKEKKFYCGVDLHKKKTYFYVVDNDGKKVEATEITTDRPSFKEFFSPYYAPEMLVAVEISSLTFWFCEILDELSIRVYVVNTLENHYLSQSLKKTDKEDARKLAIQLWKEILPPPVYIPTTDERKIRDLISHRHFLIKAKTRVINRTSHLLANYELKFSRRALSSKRRWQELYKCFKSGKINDGQIIKVDNVVLSAFNGLYHQFLLIGSQILRAEKLLLKKLGDLPRLNDMYQKLLTIPGMGPITSSALIGCIGDIKRFKSGRRMVSYLGLCPKVRESGGKSLSNGGITKRGNSRLRGYFIQAAMGALCSRGPEAEPLKAWYERIRRKKGWRTARIALARKLAIISFGVLKTNKPYDPLKVKVTATVTKKNTNTKPESEKTIKN
jgi:transposase